MFGFKKKKTDNSVDKEGSLSPRSNAASPLPPKPGPLPPKPANIPPKPGNMRKSGNLGTSGSLPPKPGNMRKSGNLSTPQQKTPPPKPGALPPKPEALSPRPVSLQSKSGSTGAKAGRPSNSSDFAVKSNLSASQPITRTKPATGIGKSKNEPMETSTEPEEGNSPLSPRSSRSPLPFRMKGKGALSKSVNRFLKSPQDKSPSPARQKSEKSQKPLRNSQSGNYISRKQKTMKVLWKLIIESGSNLPDYDLTIEAALFKGEYKKNKWKNETFHFPATSKPSTGPFPQWKFVAYSLPAGETFGEFNGVKITCCSLIDGDPQIIGSIVLTFGSDLPHPPTPNEASFTLYSKGKKDKNAIGTITLKSLFSGKESTREVLAQSDPSTLRSMAMKRSDMIYVTASGRREIRYQSENVNTVYGELPPIAMGANISSGHGYDATIALWLVTCCQLAYRSNKFIGEVVRNIWDMFDFCVFEDLETDTRGFCVHNDEILIICFRGTNTLQNWITNLKFIMVPPYKLPPRYQKLGIQVHTGFYDAINSVFPTIKGFIDKAYNAFPSLKLFICGHSLGGALAQLCYGNLVLSNTPRIVTAVYTVGQPRAANKKFKELVEQLSPDTVYIRITNNQDCVPSLANGQHCGVLVHIQASGEFSFDPPTWKKAIASAHALQNSAASLSYAAIADHLTGVYRKRIENYWLKFQSAKISSDDGAFGLCEQILILSDFLVEDVKFVRRYKPQFRAIIHQVIKSRSLIVHVQNLLGGGIDEQKRTQLTDPLRGFFESLSTLRKSVQERQSKLSVLQQVSSSEKTFNIEMTKQCSQLQNHCDQMNEFLKRGANGNSKKRIWSQLISGYSWMEPPPEVEKYDPKKYDISFNTINFDAITTKMKQQVSDVVPISKLLQFAEEMVDEGKYQQALRVLEETKAKGGNVFSAEDSVQYEYLSAQAHAQLNNYQEAMKALDSISESGIEVDTSSIMQSSAFSKLRSIRGFSALEKRFKIKKKKKLGKQEVMVANLNNFELHSLSRLFDEGDEQGDNCLTRADLELLVARAGGLHEILSGFDWHEEGVDKQVIYQQILQDIQTKYQNAIDLDQFIGLMAKLMPS